MTAVFERAEIDRFKAVVAARFGFQFDDGKTEFLTDVLRRRIAATGSATFDDYLTRLESPRRRAAELHALAEQLTVGETYFFRNADNFRALVGHVLPERLRQHRGERRLRILSAGCSSGDEPYSLAIVLRESVPEIASWDVEILGVDLNPAALARATGARYTAWSLRTTPDEVRRRYFRADGRDFVLDDSIRRMVNFEERNLAGDDASFWRPAKYDVVFCRNVIMYFTPEVMQRVVRRLHGALRPNGFLFLGHAETLRGISHGFTLHHTHDTFYYQRRELPAAGDERPVSSSDHAEPFPDLGAETDEVIASTSWVDVIRQASERIASLAGGNARPPERGLSAAATRRPAMASRNLGLVLEAMRQERFSDALELLASLSPDSDGEVDGLLLRAALYTNSGRLDEAEAVCRRLLALDELNAGAHYLMALCREHARDAAGAAEHDQTAIYLDATFAMPHLHLGLMARRAGDVATAERELDHALSLLAREDASRVLLFGGGFHRDALAQLCRAELRGVESAR